MSTTFKEAFYFFRHNLMKLIAYTLLIGILVIILAQILVPLFFAGLEAEQITSEVIEPFAQLMNLLIKPIYTGGLIILIDSLAHAISHEKQEKSIISCLFSGIKRWPFMFMANLLTSMLVFVGLLVFILPGIWIFSRLFLVPYLVMLDKQSPFTAIRNSFIYTRGYSLILLNDIIFLIVIFFLGILVLNFLQLLYPLLLLLLLLIFQTMANVIYYRHYEVLMKRQLPNAVTDEKN
jgi:hypothetical protein